MAVNNNDLKLISDAVLDNRYKYDELPQNVQDHLYNYWQSTAPTDPTSGGPDVNALARERAKKAEEVGGTPFFLKPIEALGSGLYWLYSKTISPMVSTVALGAHRAIYGKEAEDRISTDFWGVEDAKDLWSDAHKVSPGQAIWMLGFNNKELRERGISPNQMAMDKRSLERGELPLGQKPKSVDYFSSGAAKWVTGTTDFALSWYADPLVIGLKTTGAAVKGAKTQPITGQVEKAGEISGKPEEAFNILSDTPTFQKMTDLIWDIKVNNPDNAALIMRRDLSTFRESPNGDTLARLAVQTNTKDELVDLLRITMGDAGGYVGLQGKSAVLESQVKALSAKQVLHNTYYDSLSDAKKASVFGQRVKAALTQQEKAIAQMDAERGIISDKMNAFKTLDNMNFNEVITPASIKVRQAELISGQTGRRKVTGQGMVKGVANTVYNAGGILPVKLVRTYNDIKPSYFIDIHGASSYKEVEAALMEHKALPREVREKWVSDYIKATPNERQRVLLNMENRIVQDMIERYNAKNPGKEIDRSIADDLYTDFLERRKGMQGEAGKRQQSYGASRMEDPSNPGLTVRIAEVDAGGGRVVPSPVFDTQLANNHVLMDFATMEKAIFSHGQKFQKAKDFAGRGWTQTVGVADTLNTVWKFGQLARIGYIGRALADDTLGQLARFGAMAMTTRIASGTGTFVTDMVRGKFMKGGVATARANMDMIDTQLADLTAMQASAKADMLRVQAGKQQGDLQALTDDYNDITDEILKMKTARADWSDKAALGSQQRDVRVGRQIFEGPLAGREGSMFADFAAGERNFANMMGNAGDWYLKRMRRQDWRPVSVGDVGAEKHLDAWFRVINDQVAGSAIGRLALEGKSESEILNWMRTTPEGKAYRKDIGRKHQPDVELVRGVIKYVEDLLPSAHPGVDAIRSYAAEGKLEKSMLEFIPPRNRPDVQMEMFSYIAGRNPVADLMDRSIEGWYRFANQLPATHLLRHPLFGQQYKANLADAMKRLEAQGVTRIDEGMRKTLESNARKAALKDVKDFTFNMDHETKMAFGLRHFGAFFGAQQESWNRWARIISDKPETLARVSQVYGAPARAGIVVDQEGNTVDAAGYVNDPVTGERKLTKYGERKILVQIPEYLGGDKVEKALGLEAGAKFSLPMSSMNIILNHGDGYLPVGAGPYVQIAANHFAQESPSTADIAKKFGILTFGPQESIWDFIVPTTGKRLEEVMNDRSEAKQRTLFYAMQVEHYKFENGLRDTEPTWDELLDRADRWSWFRVGAAFFSPVSINQEDPYQFFRDEHNRMQKLDPESADEKFYEKYGDSFYMFSRSMSQNNTGVKPTVEGVQMSAYYQDLIDRVGHEYAGLIVGAEGDGDYSNGAFRYQQTHSAGAGSDLTQRETLSAGEAWKKGQRAKGWQQYNSFMDGLNAQLFKRGLESYDDPGAEDLKSQKQALVFALTKQTLPDGTPNSFYNEAWEEDFNSFDKGKYDRNAAKLWEITEDPELWAKAKNPDGSMGVRSDIATLRTYLEYRREMQKALTVRKKDGGSDDIRAQSNADLKDSWDRLTLKLLEADTKFGWIHSRYFNSDMGYNRDTINMRLEAGENLGTTP